MKEIMDIIFGAYLVLVAVTLALYALSIFDNYMPTWLDKLTGHMVYAFMIIPIIVGTSGLLLGLGFYFIFVR